jgi:poly(3-hydroxybutyrate) depolymerase
VRTFRSSAPIAGWTASSQLVSGSTGVTEVLLQQFIGHAAFLQGTVINGGHHWPMPTTRGNPPVAEHFDATRTIVEFWQRHAGLP